MSKIKKVFKNYEESDIIQRQDILLNNTSNFAEFEAYKILRTNLFFSLVKNDSPCKTIMMTSAVSREGKSTVCMNLARVMSQTKNKVLIIDCDLRKPRLHKFFNTKCVPGLSNVLIGENTIEEVLNPTDEPNLSAIYSGVIPLNPAEMLGSEEMKRVLNQLKERFDYILLDCTPVLPVADSLVISSFVNDVLIVAMQNYTTKSILKEAVSKLEFAGARIMGIILNGLDIKEDNKYKKYSKYY